MKKVEGWDVKEDQLDGFHLIKKFKFKNFIESQKFVNEVGNIAESQGHHPDIIFGWGYAKVQIFTQYIYSSIYSKRFQINIFVNYFLNTLPQLDLRLCQLL